MEDRPGVLHCSHLRGNQEGEGLLRQRGSQGGCRVQDISVASCSHSLSSSVSWPAPLHPPNYRRSVSISTDPKQMVSERKQWLAQRALSICSQGRLLWLQVRPGLVLLLLVTSQQSSGNGVNTGSQFSLSGCHIPRPLILTLQGPPVCLFPLHRLGHRRIGN